MRRSWFVLIILSLVLSLSIPLLYGGLDSLRAVARVPPLALAGLLGMVLLGWMCNAARITLLANSLRARLSCRRALGTVVAAEFAGVATPANAGGMATYVFLLSRRKLSAGDAAAVVAVDQLTDLVFFATTVPIAVLLFAVEGGISHPLRLLGLLLAVALLGLGALYLLIRHYRRLAIFLGRRLHHTPRLRSLRYRLARALIRFRRSIGVMLNMGIPRLVLVYLFCSAHWMLRYSILPILLWVLGEAVPWGYLFVMQGLLLFLGQITFLPGGGGGIELGFSALLAPYLDATTSAAALLIWRFCTFYWYLLAGAPVFAFTAGDLALRRAPRAT